MRRFLYRPATAATSAGLLVLRLVMGAAFVIHGWGKIQSPFSWMGDAPIPGFLQALAAISEFGGGILLLLGLLTPLAALGILFTMAGALFIAHFPQGHPFVASGGPSFELPLVYLAAALLFLVAGPGRFSLDYALFGRSTRDDVRDDARDDAVARERATTTTRRTETAA